MFGEKHEYKHREPESFDINELKTVNFQDPITNIYKKCFVLSLLFCMAGEQ